MPGASTAAQLLADVAVSFVSDFKSVELVWAARDTGGRAWRVQQAEQGSSDTAAVCASAVGLFLLEQSWAAAEIGGAGG
jgi:hypothetical protein